MNARRERPARVVLGADRFGARHGPSVVTVGMFDGVHVGHAALLDRVVDRARAEDRSAVAVTFDRHPLRTLRPELPLRLLTSLRRRVGLLAATGVDVVLILRFTPALSRMPAAEFVTGLLGGVLRAERVVVGENFRFGHRAAGDLELLHRVGGAIGIAVEGAPTVRLGGARVSSTRIRESLGAGAVELAAELLGRPYEVAGYVVRGAGRGRALGVPTANLGLPRWQAVPARGIYAGRLAPSLDVRPRLPAAVSVGVNPTFDGTTERVEAHLLDADLDLYGRRVALSFEHRLRDERRFAGAAELVAQMRGDLREARKLLAGPGGAPAPPSATVVSAAGSGAAAEA